jgi:hypothetical protein
MDASAFVCSDLSVLDMMYSIEKHNAFKNLSIKSATQMTSTKRSKFMFGCRVNHIYALAWKHAMQVIVMLLFFGLTADATQRVVLTFETSDIAAMTHSINNATIIKQYGRRMVLDLHREAELPEAWLARVIGFNVTVELDELVTVKQLDWNEVQDEEFEDEDPQTTEPDYEPQTTIALELG